MQVPYTNTKTHAVHVGSKRIDPGETRDVDAALVAPAKPAAEPAAADPDAHLREIQAGKAEEIKGVLADLDEAGLERLEALEGEASRPRKGVLEAIEAEKLERAKQRGADGGQGAGGGTPGDPDLENFKAEIQEMPAEELDDLRALYAETEGYEAYVEAIDADKKRREQEAAGNAAGN